MRVQPLSGEPLEPETVTSSAAPPEGHTLTRLAERDSHDASGPPIHPIANVRAPK